MISADYCRVMARYNRWQNQSLIAAADTLTDAARRADRGAFFGSIHATSNHLYWADALILARLQGTAHPQGGIIHSLTDPADWTALKALRAQRDAEIEAWAAGLRDADLIGQARWVLPGGTEQAQMPQALCAVQLFSHQTHHRGQIHAMLTAAGAQPGVTDLSAMPGLG